MIYKINIHNYIYQKHFGDVAGAEDLVDGGEFVGLLRGEIGRERAFLGAASPEKLTSRARSDCVQRP